MKFKVELLFYILIESNEIHLITKSSQLPTSSFSSSLTSFEVGCFLSTIEKASYLLTSLFLTYFQIGLGLINVHVCLRVPVMVFNPQQKTGELCGALRQRSGISVSRTMEGLKKKFHPKVYTECIISQWLMKSQKK